MTNKAIWAACVGVCAILAGRAGAQVLPNGVSAGDTTTDSTVLWTHSTVTGNVRFDISTDPTFGSILASYNASVTDSTLPVKADVAGLSSGTRYYYRAVAPDVGQTTVGGTFKTAAACCSSVRSEGETTGAGGRRSAPRSIAAAVTTGAAPAGRKGLVRGSMGSGEPLRCRRRASMRSRTC